MSYFHKLYDVWKNVNLNITPGTMKKTPLTPAKPTLMGMLIVVSVVFFSCKTSTQKQQSTESSDVEPSTEVVIQELSGYPIPTAYEITELIFEAGAPYILPLSNAPENVGNYITESDKALNLGIYGADLCYATTYMMKQGTRSYLEVSRKLVDELGISTPFNLSYAERVEHNMDNRDSIIEIVSLSFLDTWDYLIKNKQDVLAQLVVCGSWIEGIYITANIAQTSKDPTAFLEILARQKNSLNELVTMLEAIRDVEEVTPVFKGLFDLRDIYKEVGDSLTAEQLEKVFNRIDALRNSIA